MNNISPNIKAPASLVSILWMMLWSASFTTFAALTKFISPEISVFTMIFVRLCFGVALILPALPKMQLSQRLPLHGARILTTSMAMICTYYAYSHLPLAFATSIGFTAPLITVMLAIVILGDRVSRYQWFMIFLGYLGVLIMLHPGTIEYNFALFTAFAANLLASLANIMVKKLSSTDSSLQILLHNSVGVLVVVGILASFYWTTPSQQDLFYMFLLGCAGTVTQYSYIRALKLADPSTVAPFEYTRLIFAVPIGYLLFAELPTAWTIVGSIVIIFSNTMLALYEARKRQTLESGA